MSIDSRRWPPWVVFISALGLLSQQTLVHAYDLEDRLSIQGVFAGVGQCQELREGAGKRDACRGPLVVRPHVSFRPTEQNELYAELAFASGNGLNNVSPFQLAPWGADLKDDLEDINGRGRNYLVNAWYRRAFDLAPGNRLHATLGIIDSTDFLDNNAFANDEYTQFLNEALVNSPQVLLPSYDLGAALQWDVGYWSIRAVYMNVGKDDEEEDGERTKLTDRDLGTAYDYLAAEIGYSARTPIGDGHYRVSFSGTSRDFFDPNGMRAERRTALAMSFDQELGDGLGAFFRLDMESDDAAIDYDSHHALGLDLRGRLWGRERDNVGLGFALLNGGNKEIKSTMAYEGYYRFVMHEQAALSADVQYMKDEKTSGKSPKGFILGLRADLHF